MRGQLAAGEALSARGTEEAGVPPAAAVTLAPEVFDRVAGEFETGFAAGTAELAPEVLQLLVSEEGAGAPKLLLAVGTRMLHSLISSSLHIVVDIILFVLCDVVALSVDDVHVNLEVVVLGLDALAALAAVLAGGVVLLRVPLSRRLARPDHRPADVTLGGVANGKQVPGAHVHVVSANT